MAACSQDGTWERYSAGVLRTSLWLPVYHASLDCYGLFSRHESIPLCLGKKNDDALFGLVCRNQEAQAYVIYNRSTKLSTSVPV